MARASRTGSKASKSRISKASPAKGRKTTKTAKAKTAKTTRSRIVLKYWPRKFRKVSDLATQLNLRTKQLNQALARQTATADILRVISQSPTDVQPVFDAIVQTAVRLIGCDIAFVFRCDGATFSPAAAAGPDGPLPDLGPAHLPIDPDANFPSRAIVGKKNVHLPDWSLIDLPEHERQIQALIGVNSGLFLPLLREDECIGVLGLAGKRANIFGESEIALAESFRDQALIAIENARLFNETREGLERQTATADILRVIASSPSNLQPVFDAIAERSNDLIRGHATTVFRFTGDNVELAASTHVSEEADAVLRAAFPRLRFTMPNIERAFRGEVAETVDTELVDTDRDLARARGFRSRVIVPLVGDSGIIGAISVTRTAPGPFARKDVELLQTFADQAVIAIQNVELFEEVQARTRDVEEALRYQTGSANILNVIASSPTDVQPVLKAIVESACELCEAHDAVVLLKDGNDLCFSAHHGPIPINTDRWPIGRGWASGRAVVDRETVHVHDIYAEDDFTDGRELSRLAGSTAVRSILAAPLLREGESVGAILLRRQEVRPFNDKQIALLQTFADQAVIAIENVRLFNETKEALARQTATSDVLKVIASSPSSLQPVFHAIAERSNQLMSGHATTVFRFVGETVELAAATTISPEADAALRSAFPQPISALQNLEPIHRGEIVETVDASAETEPEFGRTIARARGFRSRLLMPLKGDEGTIGFISLTRKQPGTFAKKDVELLQTFADQAVIAISNVELFNEVQQRTQELSQSLDDLRNAQDRLVQTEKLASLGQLTAGIAHEIKNPLNFVNNFSALSAELVDEVNEVLKGIALDLKSREELEELTSLLKSNLEKVVQHGKRADSIVKNMLLHSREGSGEHGSVDINALVEESINLAYHGARAEKSGFEITLRHDLDPDAGAAELYPQEITRALMNLISNGFYAATRRKAENGETAFEPTLLATTRSLGSAVQIRIRDNGTGIPPEVKEKMFNPFFTTKPAGEGTGLGLSMTHDIIVKQHGGRIDVETEAGVFTDFIITLPRNAAPDGKPG